MPKQLIKGNEAIVKSAIQPPRTAIPPAWLSWWDTPVFRIAVS